MIKTVTRVLVVRDRETGNDSAIPYDVPQADSYADLINILDEYTLTRLANDFLNTRARERAKYDYERYSQSSRAAGKKVE